MDQTQLINLLKDSDLFQGLQDGQVERIAKLASIEQQPGNVFLFKQNQRLTNIYLVQQGAVHLTMSVRVWQRAQQLVSVVSVVGKGGTFGWPALVEPNMATFSAETIRRTSLVSIDAGRLRQLMEEDYPMGYRIMSNLANLVADRLRATQEAVQRTRVEELKDDF